MSVVKHKMWVDYVERIRPNLETRYGLVRLDKNERTTPFNGNFINRVLSKITSEQLGAYPEVEPFYKQLSRHVDVDVNSLVVTAGSDAAIRHCFELFVNPGDRVVVLEPTFAMVDVYCGLFNADRFAIGYDGTLMLDFDRLLSGINQYTSLVIIANPNSPTGTLMKERDLRNVLKKAKENSVPVLVDEAYYGFCAQSAASLLSEFDNLIVSRTFSKAYGLAGMRIGFLMAHPSVASLLYRFRPMYEVNALGVYFAMSVIEEITIVEQYIAETNKGKKYLLEEVGSIGMRYVDTHTNFVHIDMRERLDSVIDMLDRRGVLVRGGLPIEGYESFLRISTGPVQCMKKVVEVLVDNLQ
jgi:histidinol-phosphate aminotransferase